MERYTQHDEQLKQLLEKTARLENEMQMAVEANRCKSIFMASMSHELRSPLNSIIGFAERIPGKIDRANDKLDALRLQIGEHMSKDAAEKALNLLKSAKESEIANVSVYCGYIRRSGSHLLGIINDILDISKIEAGKLELNFETFEVKRNIELAVESFSGVTEEKNQKLILNIEKNMPKIRVDRTRFIQILINLISNAIKHSDPGTEIKVSAKLLENNRSVELCICDSGTGIPKEFQENLFMSYMQANKFDGNSGTGLGLAIAKRLVDLMGGKIWFESEEGHGSSFYFTLPTELACNV